MDITTWQPSSLVEASADSTSASTTHSQSPPAPLSLNGITRRYCREELIVSPIRWTGRHVELLQFSFTELIPEPVTAATTVVTEKDYSEEKSGTRHLKDFFDFYYKPLMREQGIWLLITTDACPLVIYTPPVRLTFGSSIDKNLHSMAFYLKDSTTGIKEHKLPVAALVDQGRIEELRKDYLGISRCKQWCHWNRPMCRLYEKKWKKLMPPVMLHDPYIIALLIGLAQQKRRYLREINSPEEAMTGKLLSQVVHTYNSRGRCKQKGEESYWGCLFLYQADIPSSLLDMFERPNVPPPESPSVEVRIIRVNYLPLATFRARLLELMLPGTAAATAAAEEAVAQVIMAQVTAPEVPMPRTMAQETMAQTTITRATMTQADIAYATMDQATMTQADLVYATMDQATMTQADLVYATMDQATMTQADTTHAYMDQATMTPADMTQAYMAQETMIPADMTQPYMAQETMAQAAAHQYAGQKRKFEGQHVDQPFPQWAPSGYAMDGYY
ncbi:hypothetical protein ACHAQJ_002509 [Trichoderma viride]